MLTWNVREKHYQWYEQEHKMLWMYEVNREIRITNDNFEKWISDLIERSQYRDNATLLKDYRIYANI